ncbi:FAD-dependent oxidoreductase [Arthrobacter sp. USHLN218]|uniref:FAD-dependent oxidoreductase n=1 Tax=Arthrobacter sp. USHLN218 TaxID=3081232 RepID=UPI00301A7FB4
MAAMPPGTEHPQRRQGPERRDGAGRLRVSCIVAGGGPAGMMLGLLLARAGLEVAVLEKHADFLRDFRGDTVHASTIRLLDELGLGDDFRRLPQSRLDNFQLPLPAGGRLPVGDFGRLRAPYNYVAMLPQWDFLNFLAEAAAREPTFRLLMNSEVTGLVSEDGRVAGVRYRNRDTGSGRSRLAEAAAPEEELRAELVVACDGRDSSLRRLAGLTPREFAVPFDVWWFRLPRFHHELGGIASIVPSFGPNEAMVALFRQDFFQIGYLTHKGEDARIRAEGVERFRERVRNLRPDFADRLGAIESLDDVHMLDVRLNRLSRWYREGLLCIGDAAHAMSPAGGVGINLAIQDAVAAARLLAAPLRRGQVGSRELARVQRRRQLPTVLVQEAQRRLHKILFSAKRGDSPAGVPRLLVFAARHLPPLRAVPARMIAFGPLPEHAPPFARR